LAGDKWRMINWGKIDNKTILVTGATGLIGKTLVEYLLRRNEEYNKKTIIIATGRSKEKFLSRYSDVALTDCIKFFEQDVNNKFEIDEKIDYIIHLASNTHPVLYATDPINTIMANVLGTYNLLELASQNEKCCFFLMSSGDIYGDNIANKKFITEDDCGYIDCNTLRAGYIEGKRASEALCNAYLEERYIDFFIGRLCRVFGPNMQLNESKAISQFILKAAAGEDILLKSSGEQIFSYLSASDAVEAMLYIISNGKSGEAYNISDNDLTMTLKDLAYLIGEIGGVNVVQSVPKATEQKGASNFKNVCLDSTKLKSLGWEPKKSIEDGLKETIYYLRGNMIKKDEG